MDEAIVNFKKKRDREILKDELQDFADMNNVKVEFIDAEEGDFETMVFKPKSIFNRLKEKILNK